MSYNYIFKNSNFIKFDTHQFLFLFCLLTLKLLNILGKITFLKYKKYFNVSIFI